MNKGEVEEGMIKFKKCWKCSCSHEGKNMRKKPLRIIK